MREDVINFSINTNDNTEDRSAVVRILDDGGVEMENIYVLQHGTASKTVNVETPGKLNSLISANEKSTIMYLSITGTLNVNDFTFIKEMTNLKYLDISGISNTSLLSNDVTSPGVPKSIEKIILPTNLERIPAEFFSFSNLKSITFPSTLKEIGAYAFSQCVKLSGDLIIPDGVTIGTKYTYQSYGVNYTRIGNAFSGCTEISTIVIGKNVNFVTSKNAYGDDIEQNLGYNTNRYNIRVYAKSASPQKFSVVMSKGKNVRHKYLGIPKGTLQAYFAAGWDYSIFETIEEVDFDKLGY